MLCIWIINSTLFSGTLSALSSKRERTDIDINQLVYQHHRPHMRGARDFGKDVIVLVKEEL